MFLALLCFFGVSQIKAQQIFFEAGPVISSFHYTDSQGTALKDLQSKTKGFLTVGYRQILNDKRNLFLLGSLSYMGYASEGSSAALDVHYSWDVRYIGISPGIEYTFLQHRDFKFFLRAIPSIEFLVHGSQTINNDVYDLKGEDEFDSHIVYARAGPGIQFPIAKNAMAQLAYSYGYSFQIAATGASQENLNISTHQVSVGLVINLPGCNCAF